MTVSVLRWVAVLLFAPLLIASAAAASNRTQVPVTITVLPIAEVEFPSGFGFTLRVPYKSCFDWYRDWDFGDWRGNGWRDPKGKWHDGRDEGCRSWLANWFTPVIRPVRIPFKVTGNAVATVTVKPSSYLHVYRGNWVGRSVGRNGATLGYQTVIHFPAPNDHYAWLGGWDDYDDWDNWRGWGGFGALPRWSHWTLLPGINNAGTPPLAANMIERGGQAWGVIYIVARPGWTTDGRDAPPGDYAGAVVLTITANNS